MAVLKLPKPLHFLSPRRLFLSLPHHFSTWYSPPPPEPEPRRRRQQSPLLQSQQDPVLSTISETINRSQTNPQFSSLKRIVPSITNRHVIDLINLNPHHLSADSIFSFFNWLSSQPSFCHTVGSYCAMAQLLSSDRRFSEAETLIRLVVSRKGKDSADSVFASAVENRGTFQSGFVFDALMIAYSESVFFSDAIRVFRMTRKHDFRIPVIGCRCLVSKMLKSSSPEAVWVVYLEFLECGFKPDVFSLNNLMHRFCKENRIDDAEMVFDEIRNRGMCSVVSYNTLINGYCKSSNVAEGFRLKKVMEENGTFPDVFTYSALISALFKEDRLEDAHKLFDEMCERELVPNDVTFTAVIHGYCKNGEITVAMEIYERMLSKGVKPDLVTYNTLIHGLCKVGDLEGARKVFDEMSARKLKPDKITYTTLLDGYCKEGDLESAFEIRDEMVEMGIKLDDVAFTALISGLCRLGRVVDAKRTLKEMLTAGVKPDVAVYNMVIDGFCKKGDVKTGVKLFKEMGSSGHIPSVVTYNVILNGLCRIGKMKEADTFLDAMVESGVVPDDITYNILLEGHCKNANPEVIYRLKSEKGLVSDYASYSLLVNELGITSKDSQRR